MKYKRVLLKLSGEALGGTEGSGINVSNLRKIAHEIKAASKKVQIAIVIGGGNIWRGANNKEIERVSADYMGMLATLINALALKDIFEKNDLPSRIQSAINISEFAKSFVRDDAIRLLNNGNIVIFAGGTGRPFFTTDTTAALRASEIKADVLLKATQVDGVYDRDPKIYPSAKKYSKLTFDEAIKKNLKIMDITAFSLCKENNLPIIVFNFHKKGNLNKVLTSSNIGTIVT